MCCEPDPDHAAGRLGEVMLLAWIPMRTVALAIVVCLCVWDRGPLSRSVLATARAKGSDDLKTDETSGGLGERLRERCVKRDTLLTLVILPREGAARWCPDPLMHLSALANNLLGAGASLSLALYQCDGAPARRQRGDRSRQRAPRHAQQALRRVCDGLARKV